MLEHPVVVEELGEVPATAVGDRRQHGDAGPVAASGLEHGVDRRPARATCQNPFFAGEPPSRQEGIAVRDTDELVDDRRVERVDEGVLADALDEVGVHVAARVDGALGIGSDDEQVGVLLLQIAAGAGDRPARADGDDDGVELAARLSQISGPVEW